MEKETEEEIARLSDELGDALRRITSLERDVREQPVLPPAGTKEEKRALELLQYLEKYGRLTSTQAKDILKCHHSGAHRAMIKLEEMFEEVKFKERKPKLVLVTTTALRTLRSDAQLQLRSRW